MTENYFFFVICFISRLKLNFLCKWRTLSKICINLKKMGKHFFKIVVVMLFTHHNKTCDSAEHAKSFEYKGKVDTEFHQNMIIFPENKTVSLHNSLSRQENRHREN